MNGQRPSPRIPIGDRIEALAREATRAGLLAGLAMIPFAAVFRARGLRVNEYGRKTLALFVSGEGPTAHWIFVFVQHLFISVIAAVPLIWLLAAIQGRAARISIGTLYGVFFYAVVNAWALPRLFGDPLPYRLGLEVVYPSLAIHVVYGFVLGCATRTQSDAERDESGP